MQVSDVRSVAVPYSAERKPLRDCTLSDPTGSIQITLWNQHATTALTQGQSVTFTGMKIGQFGKDKKAQTTWKSTISVNTLKYFVSVFAT
jgi:ssDNA-binding replication factor A large subunit